MICRESKDLSLDRKKERKWQSEEQARGEKGRKRERKRKREREYVLLCGMGNATKDDKSIRHCKNI